MTLPRPRVAGGFNSIAAFLCRACHAGSFKNVLPDEPVLFVPTFPGIGGSAASDGKALFERLVAVELRATVQEVLKLARCSAMAGSATLITDSVVRALIFLMMLSPYPRFTRVRTQWCRSRLGSSSVWTSSKAHRPLMTLLAPADLGPLERIGTLHVL
jgi:hypothetical protein